jgi:AcrR family transcriptional regulator
MEAAPSPAGRSEPRERLLATAAELFYRDGIHSVGVDRIVETATVTRATFYRHFPGKEDLVRAYLQSEDEQLRTLFAAGAEAADSPETMLEAIIQGIAADVVHNHVRGCPFINAAAEYPDPESPVRKAIQSHRDWFHGTLLAAFEAAGADDAPQRARALVLLRDAALVGGYLDGPEAVLDTFVSTARQAAGLS